MNDFNRETMQEDEDWYFTSSDEEIEVYHKIEGFFYPGGYAPVHPVSRAITMLLWKLGLAD